MSTVEAVIARARTGAVRAEVDGTTHAIFPISIDPREGEALSGWVAREHAASSVEVGLGYGLSSLFILRGLLLSGSASFRHLAIDPNQKGFSNIGVQLISEAQMRDRFDFYAEPSEIVLPRLLSEGRQFDFAFIDGNHRFDWVFVDLMFLGRLLRGGSVLFLDDFQLPAIRKAVSFSTRNLGWTIEEEGVADDNHHWVVLRTPTTPQGRAFDYFVDF